MDLGFRVEGLGIEALGCRLSDADLSSPIPQVQAETNIETQQLQGSYEDSCFTRKRCLFPAFIWV